MKLDTSGYFAKNGEIIGKYVFSFHDCTFHWWLFNGITHDFWKEGELIKEAETQGWEIVSPNRVEVIYKLKG